MPRAPSTQPRQPAGPVLYRMNPSFWDNRYAVDDFVFGTAPNEFLRECAERIPAGPVLCLGEGEGRNAVFLAGRGHAVTAVDQSTVGLAKARELWDVRPGDLIFTGTPDGVGPLRPGDRVEATIEGLQTLSFTVLPR